MTKYWLKIALGATLIFVVGFSLVSALRGVKGKIESSRDLQIPLGPFVGFKLNGTKVGTLRSITILRSAPKVVSGFNLSVRLSDSAAYTTLQNCHLTVNEPTRIDERTTFFCLPSDSGFIAFGEVRVELRDDTDNRVLVQPLLLPESAVREIQRHGSDSVAASLGDSIAREVESRIRPQAQAYGDSIRAARLERDAKRLLERADSIRARAATPAPAPAPPAAQAAPVRKPE